MKIALVVAVLLSIQTTTAQEFPKMDASPMDLAMARADRNSPPMARVIYSRPQLKGRSLSKLAPNGKVWRTGANEATELTLYNAMMLGNKKLEAGTYTLYTIPGEDNWTIIINSDTNAWGSYSYKEEKDVVRIDVPRHDAPAQTESLSMVFRPESDGTTLMIGWDRMYVEVPFKSI
tara:strand:- start:56562 stop:57089 length:528 start_codon:yes stop_codon:yes gene_type:complete